MLPTISRCRGWAIPLLLLASCGGENLPGIETPIGDGGPIGFYSGAFPCDDCPGIMSEIYLHENGVFFGRQEYLSGSPGTRSTANTMGRWFWFADDELLVLQARGPERRFSMPVPGVLELSTQLDGDHRLFTGERPQGFPGTLLLSGTLERRGERTVFEECITGLKVPVEDDAEHAAYLRQLRRAGNLQGPIYAEFDGEYAWSPNGDPVSMVITRFGTIRPGRSCGD